MTARRMNRRAVAGRCRLCGARVVRGLDDTGALAVTDVGAIDSTQELACYADARPTYAMRWAGLGIELTLRSPHQMLSSPAGFSNERVVAAHRCESTDEMPDDNGGAEK